MPLHCRFCHRHASYLAVQGWLLPSEIQPLETRSAGQGLTVAVNFLFTFVIGQCFLSMLCAFQVGPPALGHPAALPMHAPRHALSIQLAPAQGMHCCCMRIHCLAAVAKYW